MLDCDCSLSFTTYANALMQQKSCNNEVILLTINYVEAMDMKEWIHSKRIALRKLFHSLFQLRYPQYIQLRTETLAYVLGKEGGSATIASNSSSFLMAPLAGMLKLRDRFAGCK